MVKTTVTSAKFRMTSLFLVVFLSLGARHSPLLFGQQPQAQSGQPIYSVNAKFVQGVGPGYWPTAGSGLTLNLAAGTVTCDSTNVSYAGGTVSLAASSTNYVFLDQSNACAPASNTTGFTDVTIPVATVTTNATSIVAVTDLRTWFNGGKNVIYNAARFPGADAGAKIMAAHNALPSTGGTIDARGFAAPTTTMTLVIAKPVHLLFGHYTYTYNGTGDMIDISPSATGAIIIEGQSQTGGTVLINNSVKGHGINNQMNINNGSVTVRHLRVTSSVAQASRITGNAINCDYGDGFTSVGCLVEGVDAIGHVFGIRLVQPIESWIIKSSPGGNWVDGTRIEGGTSSTVDTVFANGNKRDGHAFSGEYHAIPFWRASAAYTLGQWAESLAAPNGHIYKVTTAGTTGATEATTACWTTTPTTGCTATDGTVTWTESGTLPSTPAGQSAMIPVWQPGTAYSVGQVVAPFFGTTLPDHHFYKCTTAGTSGTAVSTYLGGEPTVQATLQATGCTRASNVVTCTATASLASQFYLGASVLIAGTTGGTTSFNGIFSITTVPSGTTFTFSQTGANESSSGGGTATTNGWTTTTAGTVSDNTVTWTEIGIMPYAAFGPVYMTQRNTAADNNLRDANNYYGLTSSAIIGSGAEAEGGVLFHFIKGQENTLISPFCNGAGRATQPYVDAIRVAGVSGLTLIGGECLFASTQYSLSVENLPSGNSVNDVRVFGFHSSSGFGAGTLNDPNNVVTQWDMRDLPAGSPQASLYSLLLKPSVVDPSGTGTVAGMLDFNSSANRPKFFDGTAWHSVLGVDTSDTLSNKTFRESPLSTPTPFGRIRSNQGTALTTGNFSISGWGTGASIAAASGTDTLAVIQISTGTSPAANPTITLTFADGSFSPGGYGVFVSQDSGNPTFAHVTHGGSFTAWTVTFQGTPTASSTYKFRILTMGF